MESTVTEFDVFPDIREIIADCLGIEPGEVLHDSHFRYDLGGESIDDLDLSFRIEKHFGIKKPFAGLMHPEGWAFDDNGRLTPDCIAGWQSRYPEIDWSCFADQSGPHSLEALLTVDNICKLVQRAVREQAGDPPK